MQKGDKMTSNMIIIALVALIPVVITIMLIRAILEMKEDIKTIKENLFRNEFVENKELGPQEDWIYKDSKKTGAGDDWT